jgi:hypothetical protein
MMTKSSRASFVIKKLSMPLFVAQEFSVETIVISN